MMPNAKRPNKRAEQSRKTHDKIVEAARELFLEHGYRATTLQDVADHAAVAVQTVYFVFRNKRSLFKAVIDTSIAGDSAPVATMERDWFQNALAADTAEEQLRRQVAGSVAVLRRTAPLTALFAVAVDADPQIAELWPSQEDPRYTVLRRAAATLVTKPDAADLTADEAADLLFGLLSPELYLVFTAERGWSPEAWEDWVYQTLRSQLCQA